MLELVAWLSMLLTGIYSYQKIPRVVPAKLLDLRKDKEHNSYAIMIIQRQAGFYGHAFISTSNYARQDTFPITKGYGFYSIGNNVMKIVRGQTEGQILDDFKPSLIKGRDINLNLIIWVDKDEFTACCNIIEANIGKAKNYELFENDCVSFVQRIAENLKLKTPCRLLNPKPNQYVEALFEIN